MNATRLAALERGAREYLHEPVGATVHERWYGWRPMTWDDLPILGRAPRHRARLAGDRPRHARGQHECGQRAADGRPDHRVRRPRSIRRLIAWSDSLSKTSLGYDYDLVVIGGGSGGLAGAFRAAAHGARVALLEPGEFGGTCVNVGCVPKKAMWLAAELSQRIDMASRLGFDLPPPKFDWREFIVHRQRYIAGIHDSYRKRLDAAGIVHLPCRGHFVDAHTVETHLGLRVSAAHILIATGGKPRRPGYPGRGAGPGVG